MIWQLGTLKIRKVLHKLNSAIAMLDYEIVWVTAICTNHHTDTMCG